MLYSFGSSARSGQGRLWCSHLYAYFLSLLLLLRWPLCALSMLGSGGGGMHLKWHLYPLQCQYLVLL